MGLYCSSCGTYNYNCSGKPGYFLKRLTAFYYELDCGLKAAD